MPHRDRMRRQEIGDEELVAGIQGGR
jgi:hypothetical protein